MKLAEMRQSEFVELLASDQPAPGGGSAAATCGTLGAALLHMVAALTDGREKYAGHQQGITIALAESDALRRQMTGIIDRDSDAFHAVTEALALPKETDEEKEVRKATMQDALKLCCETPSSLMRCALESLRLCERVFAGYNTNAASDLGVAVLCLRSALQGAWLNVLINLGSIRDKAFVAERRAECKKLLDAALPLADRLYAAIEGSLA